MLACPLPGCSRVGHKTAHQSAHQVRLCSRVGHGSRTLAALSRTCACPCKCAQAVISGVVGQPLSEVLQGGWACRRFCEILTTPCSRVGWPWGRGGNCARGKLRWGLPPRAGQLNMSMFSGSQSAGFRGAWLQPALRLTPMVLACQGQRCPNRRPALARMHACFVNGTGQQQNGRCAHKGWAVGGGGCGGCLHRPARLPGRV